MKRVAPTRRPGISGEYAPEVDVVVVRSRLKRARFLDEEDRFIAFLNEALTNYWCEKLRDEASATPRQVKDFAGRLARVAAQLQPQDEVEGTVLRAAISPFDYADLTAKIGEVVDAVEALEVGEPKKGSGPRLMRQRQLRLAGRFWQEFVANGWRRETSEGSLMAQLLVSVLKAVGERRGSIKQLLEEAKPNT